MLSTPNSNANITTFSSRYSESNIKNMCILLKIATNISSYIIAQKLIDMHYILHVKIYILLYIISNIIIDNYIYY